MAGKRFRAEQIIMKLREAEVGLAQGQRVGQVSKQMGVSEQTYYRWRKEYGGLRLDQANTLGKCWSLVLSWMNEGTVGLPDGVA